MPGTTNWEKKNAIFTMGPMGELNAIILLNGHTNKQPPKFLSVGP